MKTLILLSSLLFSAYAFSEEISEEPVETHNIEISVNRDDDNFSYYFGNVKIGQISYVKFNVINNGSTRLDFKSSRLEGNNAYKATTNCSRTLFPGQRCKITLIYAPFFEGPSAAVYVMNFLQDYRVRAYVSGNANRY